LCPRAAQHTSHTLNYNNANKHHLQEKHTHSKVYARDSIHDDKDIRIGQLLEAEI